jgi:hypothetical protein
MNKKRMVRIKGVLTAMLLVLPLLLNSKVVTKSYQNVEFSNRIIQIDVEKVEPLPKELIYKLTGDPEMVRKGIISPMDEYKYKLGVLESGGRYKTVNSLGYLGKYQFSRVTLLGLIKQGYLEASVSEIDSFTHNPELQERAMDALIEHNTDILIKRYRLGRFIGTKVNGIKITLRGMLASAHLLGPYAVKDFLHTGGSLAPVRVSGKLVRKYDAYGTSLTDYLKQFKT